MTLLFLSPIGFDVGNAITFHRAFKGKLHSCLAIVVTEVSGNPYGEKRQRCQQDRLIKALSYHYVSNQDKLTA
eukprot:CAMPEP_0119028292 /NCGR_PEP_ID=MMETSP1176-20130426/38634_1 /TAXON_ID=265551 /ORGANISM="Synedropsis recta cf, Strain CCMP1620" /LENGTH=72 /DNA_ID=CAMNT_0006984401 /DNA_START=43 /DNA_END=264 /DNA_ORIENTATION=+